MSGQWEVVGGKKDRRSKVPIPKGNNKQPDSKNKKPNILNGVKIEEVLPKSQVQNLYTNKQHNKENKHPDKVKNVENKKSEKKSNKASPAEPPRPKPPKSIESALLCIDPKEFASVYDRSKNTYPDAPIVWLKELTLFLNQKIPVEIQDPVFSSKPQGFPLNVVPGNVKVVIEKAVKEAGQKNAQLYFDIALTSLVTDLSKGLPAVGYRFFLQYIALNEPKLVADNIAKHASLRNSYQNRANITLSILWSVGHIGINDLHCGLTAFEELMLPLLELKSYSRYVVKYLLDLISRDYETQLTKDQYLLILDVIFSNKKNFPVELQKDLIQNLPKLKGLLFNNRTEKYNNYVEVFLKKIASNSNKSYQNCLCDIIVEILTKDQSTLASWNKMYAKNLPASTVLLSYINDNYDEIKPVLKTAFKDLLLSFITINEELSLKKRKEDGLKDAVDLIKIIQEKKTTPKKHGSFFGSLFKFLIISAILGIGIETIYKAQQGRYQDSSVRKITCNAKSGLLWVDARIQENFPEYHKKVVEISQPYVMLIKDLGKIFVNILININNTIHAFVQEKYPVVLASVENYAPGLIENTENVFKGVCAKSAFYFHTSVDYLQKEVFVGQLSPENMQRVVVCAFNTTSQKAIEYYHWVYEKVQTTIK